MVETTPLALAAATVNPARVPAPPPTCWTVDTVLATVGCRNDSLLRVAVLVRFILEAGADGSP